MKSKRIVVKSSSNSFLGTLNDFKLHILFNIIMLMAVVVVRFAIFQDMNVQIFQSKETVIHQDISKINNDIVKFSSKLKFIDIDADDSVKDFSNFFKDYVGLTITKSQNIKQGYIYKINGKIGQVLSLLYKFKYNNLVPHKINKITLSSKSANIEILIYGVSNISIDTIKSLNKNSNTTPKMAGKNINTSPVNRFNNNQVLNKIEKIIAYEKTLRKLRQEIELITLKTEMQEAKLRCQKSGACIDKLFIKSNKSEGIVRLPLPSNKIKKEVVFKLIAIVNDYVYFDKIDGRYKIGDLVDNNWKVSKILGDGVILSKKINGTIKNKTILLQWILEKKL